jgi:hypothetical protein
MTTKVPYSMLAGAHSVLRFDTHPSDDPYLAAGDGTTDDSAAFAAFEAAVTGRTIDLRGRSFELSAYPAKNAYTNGRFVLAQSTTIGGVADAYSWYAGAGKKPPLSSPINILRDCSAGLANRNHLLTQVLGLQGFAFDEKAGKIYTLHVDGTPEVSYISEYLMAGGTAARAASGVSNANAQLGHQGIGLEYLADGTVKLWGSVRYDATNYPLGGRQAIRFNYAGNAADISNIAVYTLFGSEFAYTTNNTMPTVSYCGRFLVAIGRKSSRDFWIRVFDLPALVAGGAGDYSSKWLHEFNVDRAIISDDTAAAFRPLQGIACDGASIYIVSGNSGLTGKRIDRYSLDGRLEQTNNAVSVGITEATADGTFYEPEGLALYKPNTTAPPCLVMCIVSAGGGAHKNRLWVMGYQATISEERETLVSGRWTPTATLGTNVAAATPGSAHYIRVGNIVHFAGRITIDPTATGFCTLELSLPIASNFTSLTDAAGVFNALGVTGAATTVDTGAIEGSVANDRLVLSFHTTDTANRAYYFVGSYEVK